MEQYEINWKNYYEILQVSPNAELSIITVAYRRLAQTYHPDIAKGPSISIKMRDINEAYEVLSDTVRRDKYDRLLKTKYNLGAKEIDEPTSEVSLVNLMKFAVKEAAKGKKRSEVIGNMLRKGVPYDVAANIASKVFSYKSGLKK